jgi:hypothetical protein
MYCMNGFINVRNCKKIKGVAAATKPLLTKFYPGTGKLLTFFTVYLMHHQIACTVL